MPLAAHAEITGSTLSLRAAWGEPDRASPLVRAQAQLEVDPLNPAERARAEALGSAIAEQLRAQGAH